MRFKRVLLLFPDYKGGHYGALRPPAGLGYLAETLKGNAIGYDILDMAAGFSLDDLHNKIISYNPDLLGISMMSFMYKRSYDIIKFVKQIKPTLQIIAGGPHISTFREMAIKECPEIDYGVIMEGEETLVELCKGDNESEIKGLIYKNNEAIVTNNERLFKENLDEIPFPRYDKFPLNKYVTEEIGIVSSRGCPYACTYCPVKTTIGRKWRFRSAINIIEEIQYWYDRGYRQFSILDDNFSLRQDRVIEVCDEIKKRNFKGIELNCNNGIRADRVNYEILKNMKEAGFKYLAFGVEAGNNRILKNINKGETIEITEAAIKSALDLGFKVTLFFIVGSPGETMDDLQDSINLALKYPVFDARFYNLIPFPQSRLYDWVKENNYFICDPEEYLNTSSHWDYKPVFATPEMNREQRVEALKIVRDVRKRIRYNSMKTSLTSKLGPAAGIISRVYVNGWFQDRLMKSSALRRNLKRLFMRATTS
jgi:anaerobic magnesium-protoporphyrin IX monomethyl ester cyclase